VPYLTLWKAHVRCVSSGVRGLGAVVGVVGLLMGRVERVLMAARALVFVSSVVPWYVTYVKLREWWDGRSEKECSQQVTTLIEIFL